MKLESAKSDRSCPRKQIAAYLDGELGAGEEFDLELHFAECPNCRAELNEQKRLLFALDGVLDERPEIELPENFAKVVATNAECRVEGLRCPIERGRALFVCLLLGGLVLFGLGADSVSSFGFVGSVADRTLAVAAFFGHLLMDLAVAVSVIVRSMFPQVVFKSAVPVGLLVVAGVFSVFFVAKILRQTRS
ncbi:MAG: zf-HC2 domain-containing protein [Acidobacteria bacterium]|nr:zf-HC2 domain-containing protein [Acidobacteriota bacterium]